MEASTPTSADVMDVDFICDDPMPSPSPKNTRTPLPSSSSGQGRPKCRRKLCASPAAPGLFFCSCHHEQEKEKAREQAAARTAKRKSLGLCKCGTPVNGPNKRCSQCNAAQRRYRAAVGERRAAAGECKKCRGAVDIVGAKWCSRCRADSRQRIQAVTSGGRCMNCHKPSAEPRCRECLDKQKAKSEAAVAEGRCSRCFGDRGGETRYRTCLNCRERSRRDSRGYHERRVAAGLCSRCPRPLEDTSYKWCQRCRSIHRGYKDRRRARKLQARLQDPDHEAEEPSQEHAPSEAEDADVDG
ncbi:hypothetical protein F4779DRAFT_594509 [Xylariaceae sp. FL0662B]|nr:hypothetical protein F4779DRAFT_594509 [Xylariaceae sp. FL0662B]